MIISLLSLIPYKPFKLTTDVKEAMNDLLSMQFKAIQTHQKQSLDLPKYNQTVTFNAKGNISHAMRIKLPEEPYQLTLMLATGRIFVRRVEFEDRKSVV